VSVIARLLVKRGGRTGHFIGTGVVSVKCVYGSWYHRGTSGTKVGNVKA